ncbi:hypothetical protein AJ80_09000 [Polytolypa hystricis UAMH7299]|uniref:Mitochondrial carrier protein n=1 Tax=Polytolypa hystricis (strain UAMH7299) TaxID=1447883 RepID=A0A2B7WXT3_POLH7|nr:hypothetical protein AJ80_09000 [Polytolypa hystricis UAMH7299]
MASDKKKYEPSLESFELYHQYHSPKNNNVDWKTAALKGPALPALGQAIAGATGAAVSTAATYPLSLIVTRLQLQRQQLRGDNDDNNNRAQGKKAAGKEEEDDEEEGDTSYDGILDAARKIYATEGGLRGLYAGLSPAIGKAVADSFFFFLAYTFLRQRRLSARELGKHAILPVWEELAVGYVAESFTKLLTTPISTVLTRKQIEGLELGEKKGGLKKKKKRESSTGDIISKIVMERGVRGLWSGYSAALFMSLNPSITFFLNELFKLVLLSRATRRRRKLPALATFLLAAMSKAIASSITYPFTVAKTRAQAAASSPPESSKSGKGEEEGVSSSLTPQILHVIHNTARSEGISSLYTGLSGEVLRGFFSHGTTMLVKDAAHELVVRAYYALLILLRQYPSSPEELLERAKARAEDLADAAVHQTTNAAGKVAEKSKDVAETVAGVGRKVVGEEERKRYVSETAALIGDYVDDEGEEWKDMYHWFWDKEARAMRRGGGES